MLLRAPTPAPACPGFRGAGARATRYRSRRAAPDGALAGCGEDGVGDGRADGSDPRLANAGGRFARRNDMDLDPRHVVDAQDLVAVEIGLVDLAFLQRDRTRQRRTQAGRFAPACACFRSYRPAVGAADPVNYPGGPRRRGERRRQRYHWSAGRNRLPIGGALLNVGIITRRVLAVVPILGRIGLAITVRTVVIGVVIAVVEPTIPAKAAEPAVEVVPVEPTTVEASPVNPAAVEAAGKAAAVEPTPAKAAAM